MINIGKIISINRSAKKGVVKQPISTAIIDKHGVVGDAHHGQFNRYVSLLSRSRIMDFNANMNMALTPGAFAENITIDGIDFSKIHILDRFKIGTVLLEVTQIGKQCHGGNCQVYQRAGECLMACEGVFCRVINEGKISIEDCVEHLPRNLNISIITLSDRAFRNEYEDRSGALAKQLINEFCQNRVWKKQINKTILPDEAGVLKKALCSAISQQANIIFTLGSTGICPRDIAPETAQAVCDKIIPGIMEHIRIKYGQTIPAALLSRGIAGIADKTLLYTLPGSVKAVKEYLTEIFQTLEHTLYMLHNIDH